MAQGIWKIARDLTKNRIPVVVVVGLVSGNKILTGQRKDNDLWTFPGGHMDEGETIIEAAIREVQEETAIPIAAEDLEIIHAEKVKSHRTGRNFGVICFIANILKLEGHTHEDPDDEVHCWKWVELDSKTTELHPDYRHAKNDFILKHLGIHQ